jgi:hypothetical protein
MRTVTGTFDVPRLEGVGYSDVDLRNAGHDAGRGAGVKHFGRYAVQRDVDLASGLGKQGGIGDGCDLAISGIGCCCASAGSVEDDDGARGRGIRGGVETAVLVERGGLAAAGRVHCEQFVSGGDYGVLQDNEMSLVFDGNFGACSRTRRIGNDRVDLGGLYVQQWRGFAVDEDSDAGERCGVTAAGGFGGDAFFGTDTGADQSDDLAWGDTRMVLAAGGSGEAGEVELGLGVEVQTLHALGRAAVEGAGRGEGRPGREAFELGRQVAGERYRGVGIQNPDVCMERGAAARPQWCAGRGGENGVSRAVH